jgi:hypothetical protein
MALVTCPDCQAQISDAAPSCPRCGRPAQDARPIAVRPPATPGDERILFKDETVTVTNVRAIVQKNTTYAMANITSVREFVEPRPAGIALCGLFLIAVGMLCLHGNNGDSALLGWLGSGMGLLMVAAFLLSKPKYWVRIGTAGAGANAIFSNDPQWTRNVVSAINSAIVTRG